MEDQYVHKMSGIRYKMSPVIHLAEFGMYLESLREVSALSIQALWTDTVFGQWDTLLYFTLD